MEHYCRVKMTACEDYYTTFTTINNTYNSISFLGRDDITEIIFTEDNFDISKYDVPDHIWKTEFILRLLDCPNLRRVYIPSYLDTVRCSSFNVEFVGELDECTIQIGDGVFI